MVLLICDFKEDKTWFISRDESYKLSAKAVRGSFFKKKKEQLKSLAP